MCTKYICKYKNILFSFVNLSHHYVSHGIVLFINLKVFLFTFYYPVAKLGYTASRYKFCLEQIEIVYISQLLYYNCQLWTICQSFHSADKTKTNISTISIILELSRPLGWSPKVRSKNPFLLSWAPITYEGAIFQVSASSYSCMAAI